MFIPPLEYEIWSGFHVHPNTPPFDQSAFCQVLPSKESITSEKLRLGDTVVSSCEQLSATSAAAVPAPNTTPRASSFITDANFLSGAAEQLRTSKECVHLLITIALDIGSISLQLNKNA
jgi:hypothetical protein